MWLLSLDTSFQCKPEELKSTTDQALNTSSGQTWLLFPETSSFSSLIIIGLALAASTHEVEGNAWPASRRLRFSKAPWHQFQLPNYFFSLLK